MKKVSLLGLALGLCLYSGSAQAILIDFPNPSIVTGGPGSTANVIIRISGLGDFAPPSLGAFDLDIAFDPDILAIIGVGFASFLGDPDVRSFSFSPPDNDLIPDVLGSGEAITVASLRFPGTVNVFEVSLLEESNAIPGVTCFFCIGPFLEDLQSSEFTLAFLTFDSLAVGTSPLGISINALGDAGGNPLTASVGSGSVAVIPEPGTLLLLGSGLAGLAAWRFRKTRNTTSAV